MMSDLFPIRYHVYNDDGFSNALPVQIYQTRIPFTYNHESFVITQEDRKQQITTRTFTIDRLPTNQRPIFMTTSSDCGDVNYHQLEQVINYMMNAAFEEKQRRNRFQQVHQFNVNQPTFAFNPTQYPTNPASRCDNTTSTTNLMPKESAMDLDDADCLCPIPVDCATSTTGLEPNNCSTSTTDLELRQNKSHVTFGYFTRVKSGNNQTFVVPEESSI